MLITKHYVSCKQLNKLMGTIRKYCLAKSSFMPSTVYVGISRHEMFEHVWICDS